MNVSGLLDTGGGTGSGDSGNVGEEGRAGIGVTSDSAVGALTCAGRLGSITGWIDR